MNAEERGNAEGEEREEGEDRRMQIDGENTQHEVEEERVGREVEDIRDTDEWRNRVFFRIIHSLLDQGEGEFVDVEGDGPGQVTRMLVIGGRNKQVARLLARLARVRSQEDCSICLEGYRPDQDALAMPCHSGHAFHEECLSSALDALLACPLCRAEPVAEEDHENELAEFARLVARQPASVPEQPHNGADGVEDGSEYEDETEEEDEGRNTPPTEKYDPDQEAGEPQEEAESVN